MITLMKRTTVLLAIATSSTVYSQEARIGQDVNLTDTPAHRYMACLRQQAESETPYVEAARSCSGERPKAEELPQAARDRFDSDVRAIYDNGDLLRARPARDRSSLIGRSEQQKELIAAVTRNRSNHANPRHYQAYFDCVSASSEFKTDLAKAIAACESDRAFVVSVVGREKGNQAIDELNRTLLSKWHRDTETKRAAK